MPIALAIHGGAWNIPDEALEDQLEGIEAVLRPAWKMLRDGATALDVVEAAVSLLEDDPRFNAGRGARLNRDGEVELDAAIMDGDGLRAGAVGAVPRVRNPVRLARRVMDASAHVLLVAGGAEAFADEQGVQRCPTEDLLVGRERERYLKIRGGDSDLVEREFHEEESEAGGTSRAPAAADSPEAAGDTVGAVALDAAGHLAAATSTGGTQDKRAGRVGDSPLLGAGTYADDEVGAVSCTGWGEGILRVVLGKTALDLVRAGASCEEGATAALRALDRVDGHAGLVLVDRRGDVAAAYSTPRMARGLVTGEGGWIAVGRDRRQLPD